MSQAKAVAGSSRDAILRRVTRQPLPARDMAVPPGQGVEALGWDELGRVVEGLALGQRPIRAAAREVTRRYHLGPRGAFILSLLSGGITYPNELASALNIGRSLVTGELARLSEAGLVTATQARDDKRRSELALTASGREACEDVRGALQRIIARNLAGYTADEIRLFARMLAEVRRLEPGEAEA